MKNRTISRNKILIKMKIHYRSSSNPWSSTSNNQKITENKEKIEMIIQKLREPNTQFSNEKFRFFTTNRIQ